MPCAYSVAAGALDLDALLPGPSLHLLLVLRREPGAGFRIGFRQPELFSIPVSLLDTHELATVDTLVAALRVTGGMRSILDAVTIPPWLSNAVAFLAKISINVFLSTLHLCSIRGLNALALPCALSSADADASANAMAASTLIVICVLMISILWVVLSPATP